MIRPHIKRFDSVHKTPILSRWEMDEYTQAVLHDYKPELLRHPGAINYQHFLESYLGLDIEFHDIYDDDPEHSILAMIAFESGLIKVYDEESDRVKCIGVPENTVILDNFLKDEGKEGLALFSGLHEGFHFLLPHKDFFANINHEEYKTAPDDEKKQVTCCRRDNIESFGSRKKERSVLEWLEYQADYCASGLAMPNATFTPYVNSILRAHGFRRGSITLGIDDDWDILAEEILPDFIREAYGVSRRAAIVKLRKNGVVIRNALVR